MKVPPRWAIPARLGLIVILEIGLRSYAARSGLAAVLLSPSGASNDIALLLALLLLLVRLTAIWIVLPLTITWVAMTGWKWCVERCGTTPASRSPSQRDPSAPHPGRAA